MVAAMNDFGPVITLLIDKGANKEAKDKVRRATRPALLLHASMVAAR